MRKILLPLVVLSMCLIGMITVHNSNLMGPVLLTAPIRYGGYILIPLGLALPAWGAYMFRHHQTNIIPYRSPDRIVTTGPFRLSRNPMYLGMLLIVFGVAVRLGTASAFVFPPMFFAIANWWYIPYEESRMLTAFGDEFLRYKTKVRRWL